MISILIPSFTQRTWSKLSQACVWVFSGLKRQRRCSSSPSSLTSSNSQSGAQVSMQVPERSGSASEAWTGESVVRLLLQWRCHDSPGSLELGLSVLMLNVVGSLFLAIWLCKWLWRTVRNFIGKLWRRTKERQKIKFSLFQGSRRVFLFSSNSTKLERIKLNILLIWQVHKLSMYILLQRTQTVFFFLN